MNSDSGRVLRAEGLAKSYLSGDARLPVLQGVDFQIVAGESVSIRGESGSGKTTLLNLLAGIEEMDVGRLEWAGESVGRLSMSQLARRRASFLGMVFQAYYLIPELNALENVLMGRRMFGAVGAEDRARAESLLGRVGLAQRAHHVPAHLSGGERQRVAVARALVNGPELILADEPTGNLDERTGQEIIDLLLEVCRESRTALVLVTHNLLHAARTNRQLVLQEGKLSALGAADQHSPGA